MDSMESGGHKYFILVGLLADVGNRSFSRMPHFRAVGAIELGIGLPCA